MPKLANRSLRHNVRGIRPGERPAQKENGLKPDSPKITKRRGGVRGPFFAGYPEIAAVIFRPTLDHLRQRRQDLAVQFGAVPVACTAQAARKS